MNLLYFPPLAVHSWSGCSWCTLLASTWTNTPGHWVFPCSCKRCILVCFLAIHITSWFLSLYPFFLLQELGQERAYISESVFAVIFCSFVLVIFHGFLYFFPRLAWSRLQCYKLCIAAECHYDLFSTWSLTSSSLPQWTFHPFVFQNKKIYTVLIWCRVLAYLVVSIVYFSRIHSYFGENLLVEQFSSSLLFLDK